MWDSWSECSVTCGGGVRSHARECQNGEPGDFGCNGPVRLSEYCQGQVSELEKWHAQLIDPFFLRPKQI